MTEKPKRSTKKGQAKKPKKKTQAKKTTAKKGPAKKTKPKKSPAKKTTAKKTKVSPRKKKPILDENAVDSTVNEQPELIKEEKGMDEQGFNQMDDYSPEQTQDEQEESLSPDQSEASNQGLELKKEQLTRTERFQEILRESLMEILGDKLVKKKLTRDVAYKLFKECFDTMVDFVRLDEENKLPLAGIGTFAITMSPPRNPVRGGVSKLSQFEEIPHLKWKPSDRYRKYLFKKILDYVEE